MRIGLIGNGYWARVTHAAGLSAQPLVTFAGVWGRDPAKSEVIAAEYGVRAYRELAELLADVDAVAFSVPPQVQSELARQAAGAGKHLLLEKPIATTVADGRRLADAIGDAGVASVVFFTGRFDAGQRAWTAWIAAQHGWDGASGHWLGSAFGADSPFDTPWRHDKGALWDIGPHVLAMLIGTLGPIERLTARGGPRDLVQLIAQHSSGAASSAALSIDTPSVSRVDYTVWGEPGIFELPADPIDAPLALSTAAGELAAAATFGDGHPCDVEFGQLVVRLLADAAQQLAD